VISPIEKYLCKRAALDARPLVASSVLDVDQVVVIPAYAEESFLFHTLASLGANPTEDRERTLVICVVNNRAEDSMEVKRENQRVLTELDAARREGRYGLRLAVVDAASEKCELPPREGVGAARKIGLDWGLAVLASTGADLAILLSLDADTLVEANYLPAVRAHYANHNSWAATTAYAHALDNDAIVQYELYLRCHALWLRHAGSPYWRTALGSRITCSAEAYAAVGGMNRRTAGEDFYFLQELVKTGDVRDIAITCVHPSGRASRRVPFGTGPRVHAATSGQGDAILAYNPEAYRVLRAWLGLAEKSLDAPGDRLLRDAEAIHPALASFLRASKFEKAWESLRDNHRDDARMVREFHRWFDGLKTLRAIHALRDAAFPSQDPAIILPWLVALTGLDEIAFAEAHKNGPAAVLAFLRESERLLYSSRLLALQ